MSGNGDNMIIGGLKNINRTFQNLQTGEVGVGQIGQNIKRKLPIFGDQAAMQIPQGSLFGYGSQMTASGRID